MLKLTQKTTVIDNKKIAYVETYIDDGKYTYKVSFDKDTKKRFNAYLRKQGFTVGAVADDVVIEDKTICL